jgi:hypothetical protein
VFECWGFLHKRHPFWGPLDIHKMGHPTAITCKIITNLDLYFACEATRTRFFFKMKSFTPCSMEEKSSSWSKSASPSEWWPHWCHSQTKTQKFVWPLTRVSRLRSAWHVYNAYLPGPSHSMLLPKARCTFCAAHQTPRGTAGPVDEMDSHAQNWCTYGVVGNPDQIFMTGWGIAACEHVGCNLGSTRISWPVQSVWGPWQANARKK